MWVLTMTLSTNGKNWIANNLGSGGCFADSGISYTDPNGGSQRGGTVDVVASMVMSSKTRGPGGETRSQMNSANGSEVDDDDVVWIGNNSYCVSTGGGGGGGGSLECSTTASFSTNVEGKKITFTDTSRTSKTSGSGTCSIRSRLWLLGSGISNTNRVCSRTFPAYNTSYNITLRVTDSVGNSRTSSRSVRTGSDPGSGGGAVCTRGEKRCVGTRGVQECRSDGTWSRTAYCPSGYHCEGAGNCVKDDTGGGGTPGGQGDDTAGPFEVTIGAGSGCPPGDPSIRMDASGGYAFYKATPVNYLGVGGVKITNRDASCYGYFTWVVKVWRGSGFSTCPTSTPVAEDASRYYDGTDNSPPISTQRIDPGDTEEVFGSIRIPTSLTGTVTLCVYLWGNFNKQSLINELKGEGYSN